MAIGCDIPFFEFYEYTYGEIIFIIEANNKKKLDNLKMQASMDYRKSILDYQLTGMLLSGKGQIPSFEDIYGFLFLEENNGQVKKQQKMDYELEAQKNRFMQFVEQHNKKN